MGKVFSTRVDKAIGSQIGILARALRTTKKNIDILDCTCGAWNREETAAATVNTARNAFRKSMTRHHQ